MRKFPLVCLMISIFRLVTGKLVLSKKYLNTSVIMDDKKEFRIFRNIRLRTEIPGESECVFIVSFKFTSLSHSANKLSSIIPMLVIAGHPGFVEKIYAVCPDDGYWQGMYQWKSIEHLNEYKESFVFRVMNRRAVPGSISSFEITNQSLTGFIDSHKINNER